MSHPPSDREKAGLAIIEQLGWGQNEGVRELDEDLWRLISETNFGAIWNRPGLSLREREVVQLVGEGKTSKEVASILGMSRKTAETHRSNILMKLNLHSTVELVLYAIQNDIVSAAHFPTAVPYAPHNGNGREQVLV